MHPQDMLAYTQGIRYFMGVPEQKALELFLQHVEKLPPTANFELNK